MKNFRFLTTALWAGLAFAVATSCGNSNKTADDKSSEKKEVKKVLVDTATDGEINMVETFTSQIEADVVNNISAQAGGRLTGLYVRVGDRVSRGQVLARIDPTQLNQAKVQLENSKREFSRINDLYEIGGVSKSQWESAQSALTIAREQYNNLLTNTMLKSPISGVVTAKNYDVGDLTSPSAPIVVVEQISPVKLVANVSEQYYAKLKRNMPVEVEADALDGQTFAGKISNIYPTVDPTTHTIGIEITVANAKQELRPGMYAKATIDFGKRKALMVPDKAVLHQMGTGERYVFVYADGKAQSRKVELGTLVGDRYEVLSGVSSGEQVIVSAVNTLTDGEPVSLGK